MAATSRRLRLGMVGGGPGSLIGPVHRIAARLDDRYELVAGAFSSDPQRSREAAASLHIAPDRAYASWQEMARDEAARSNDRLDLVSIVTPNHLHHGPACAFLEAGFHVMCDKPLTASLPDARDLAETVRRSGRIFGLTHNYSGYPMVRLARAMVAAGRLGRLRVLQVEYAQGWLAQALETTGHKQAGWRTDPARSGAGGALGDIGTHAYQLAAFVTGEQPASLSADLQSFGAGRTLDDNAHMLLRYESGLRGVLWASQVAVGHDNGLRLRLYGETGGLSWEQEHPEQLVFTPIGEPPRTLTRGGPEAAAAPAAGILSRIPPGHPEGFLEGFAQLYTDLAEQITARLEGRAADPQALLVPGVEDGVDGLAFVAGAVASSRQDGRWLGRGAWADDPA